MTLSYARQQQLDDVLEDFMKTASYKTLVQWIGDENTDVEEFMLKQEMSHMAPMHTNVAGGKQSHITRDYTLIPQEALASLARVMYNGAMKYSKDNWKLIHKRDHLNHALNHVNLYLAGNTSEDHLAHAATRMMMALELDLTEENDDA